MCLTVRGLISLWPHPPASATGKAYSWQSIFLFLLSQYVLEQLYTFHDAQGSELALPLRVPGVSLSHPVCNASFYLLNQLSFFSSIPSN